MSAFLSTDVSISLLGPPVVSLGGEPFSIPRRQVRALLYRLAADPKPLSRGYLSFLYWEDLPERTARQNLSRLLVYLNSAMPIPSLIQTDEEQVQLDPGLAWVDTRAFDQHWEVWKSTHQIGELQMIINLYRGTFLTGFSLPGRDEFNSWVEVETEYWEQRYLKILALLIAEKTECGDLLEAIDYANRYLACNNLAEEIHRWLIELHAHSGDRNAALRQYELCSTILERELGVKPAPETQAAYQAVLSLKSPAKPPMIMQPAWTILPSLDLPFVGRHEILQTLEGALARSRDGKGEVVFISGEPGIGKSRMMQEFTHRPRLRTRLLVGPAAQESSTLPYQPLVEALRPLLRIPDLATQVPKIWIVEAGRLFPELAEIYPQNQPPTPLSADEARARLFEAIYHILVSLTEGGYTLLLCLEDLHWADATSLDWLAYFSRHISRHRILIIGSYRPGEAKNLIDLRQSLARHVNFSELTLAGLDCREVSRLVDYLENGRPWDEYQVERMRQATGGNPFFILETIRVMLEASPGQEKRLDPTQFPLPETVQAAISARLERLQPQVRQILEAASILGSSFSPELIQPTSGRQEMEILDGLDELVVRQFLTEQSSGYQFCHAVVRDAVYASLGYWRRMKLHQRAAQALEKLGSNDSAALSWHFEQAGELSKAAHYALQAGQAAKAIFAHTQARDDFERALALLALDAMNQKGAEYLEANRRMRIQALYERGWVFRLLGEMEAYTRDLEEVSRLAQLVGDPRLLAHLRWREAYNHRWFCRYAATHYAASEGLSLSQEIADPFMQALCLRELGMACREKGEYDQAQTALEQALDLFSHQTNEIVYTIHTLGNLSTMFTRLGDADQAMELARQALEICERSDLPYERRLPLGDMGAAAIALGDSESARSWLSESLSIAHEIADCTQEIICQGHLGTIEMNKGDFAAAYRFLLNALELADRIGSATEKSWLYSSLAEAYLGLDNRKLALTLAHQALEIAQAYGRAPDQSRAQQILERLRISASPPCE